ncbi:MAG: TatD family hydrolase [Candidatus Polarisedimenticolaceae bacterium]|nr:TatD family hydrolase [Candidatus Polarisedimenticolaceae bacterium]
MKGDQYITLDHSALNDDVHLAMIDTHVHIDDQRFDHDRLEVIERAKAAGITRQIVPAIKAAWWPRLKACCSSDNTLLPTYGLHPMFVKQHQASDLTLLSEWLRSEPAVAVGECGLDFYAGKADQKQQHDYFEVQLDLARQFGLPVIIHARRSVEDVIKILRKKPGLHGVLHSYSGSYEQAVQLIDLGFVMGFGGPATNPHSTRLHQTIKALPLEAIVLETDAPDQPCYVHRKHRNEPAELLHIASHISHLRKIELTRLIEATTDNSRHLFNLSL